ncbi:hypothetical protein V6L80_00290 (plasmid) [Erwinia persicina]|uniref:hypothetical protein n=1 Tax=Erwinia persicina TaxID=55211 RepID=UPI0030D05116
MNNSESSTDRWLRTGLVVFLAILMLAIIFTGSGKGSDVSNWVIAAANIAMAAAAVKAWRAAQKFLGEFFAQEGYRLAIALINDNVIHLGIHNELTIVANKAIAVCRDLTGRSHTAHSNNVFTNAVKQLETLQNQHVTILNNIRALSFKMETYGIYPSENIKNALTDMVLAMDAMNRHGGELLRHLSENASAYNNRVKSGKFLNKNFYIDNFTIIQKHMADTNREWNLMVNNRIKLLSGGKHARTLFVVRES